jgi:ribulose kinase
VLKVIKFTDEFTGNQYGLCVDFGTSGARTSIIAFQGIILSEHVLLFNQNKAKQASAMISF